MYTATTNRPTYIWLMSHCGEECSSNKCKLNIPRFLSLIIVVGREYTIKVDLPAWCYPGPQQTRPHGSCNRWTCWGCQPCASGLSTADKSTEGTVRHFLLVSYGGRNDSRMKKRLLENESSSSWQVVTPDYLHKLLKVIGKYDRWIIGIKQEDKVNVEGLSLSTHSNS